MAVRPRFHPQEFSLTQNTIPNTHLTRRTLLKAGSVLGGMAMLGVPAHVHAARMPLHIGVRAPAQTEARLHKTWMDTLRQELALHRDMQRIVWSDVPKQGLDPAGTQLRWLVDLDEPANVAKVPAQPPVLFGHAGARAPRAGTQSAEVTLGLWQAAYAGGLWLATHAGRTAAVISSFYESGYDAPFAFESGFNAGRGEIVLRRVIDIPPSRSDFAGLFREVLAAGPDVVYIQMSGARAVECAVAFASIRPSRHIQLAGDSRLMHAIARSDQEQIQDLVAGALWHPGTQTPARALGALTARHIVNHERGEAADPALTLYRLTMRNRNPIVHAYEPLGAISAVPALVFDGPRSGWSTPLLIED
jgi:hypothetical protein